MKTLQFWMFVLVSCLCTSVRGFSSSTSSNNRRAVQRQRTQSSCGTQRYLSSSSSSPGLFGEQWNEKILPRRSSDRKQQVEWQIFIDHSKPSLDKGAAATLDAFAGFVSTMKDGERVQVIPAIMSKSSSSRKQKSPWIRCISTTKATHYDIAAVDSVDKVYRILTKHLQVMSPDDDRTGATRMRSVRDALYWKHQGTKALEAGGCRTAIASYNKAMEGLGRILNKSKANDSRKRSALRQQEGMVLLLRASAYWKQSQIHKERLQSEMEIWNNDQQQINRTAPGFLQEVLLQSRSPRRNGKSTTSTTVTQTTTNPALAMMVLKTLQQDGKKQRRRFRTFQYRHGLYQYSLLHAAQDSLRATEALSDYSQAWFQAANVLCDLWKLKESRQYYDRAAQTMDPANKKQQAELQRRLKKLERRQDLLNEATSNKAWNQDSLRLALDISV